MLATVKLPALKFEFKDTVCGELKHDVAGDAVGTTVAPVTTPTENFLVTVQPEVVAETVYSVETIASVEVAITSLPVVVFK